MQDVLYIDREAGAFVAWTYSDGQKVYVLQHATLKACIIYAQKHHFRAVNVNAARIY